MILNLVSVLFHLIFYQYLIFRILILIRRSLLHEHIQQKWLMCTQAVEGASIQRALLCLFWDLKAIRHCS